MQYKHPLILLFIALCCSFSLCAQIKDVYYPEVGHTLYDAHFFSQNKVIASGSFGIILHSDSLFTTWSIVQTATKEDLRSLIFFDESSGIAVGDRGVILTSSDGGKNWTQQYSGVSGNLYRVVRTGSATAFCVGENGVILRTENKGASWSRIESFSTLHLYDIQFNTAGIGVISGAKGSILRSVDGGQHWQQMQTTTRSDLYAVAWHDDATCVCGGDSVVIVRSSDSAKSWSAPTYLYQPYVADNDNRIHSIVFSPNGKGYLVGKFATYSPPQNRRVWKSNDAGATWERVVFENNDHRIINPDIFPFERVRFFNDSIALALGSWSYYTASAVRSIDGGATWYPAYFTKDISWDSLGNFVYPNFYALHFENPAKGMVGGANGRLVITEDSCKTWTRGRVGNSTIRAMGRRGDFMLMAADSGAIHCSQDGGKTWQSQDIRSVGSAQIVSPSPGSINITNDSTAYLYFGNFRFSKRKDRNYYLYTTNRGKEWKGMEKLPPVLYDTNTNASLQGWFFISNEEVWLRVRVETSPKIFTNYLYYTRDGGNNWIDRTPTTILKNFDDISIGGMYFLNGKTGWICAKNLDTNKPSLQKGLLYLSTNDSGKTWGRYTLRDDKYLGTILTGDEVSAKLLFSSRDTGIVLISYALYDNLCYTRNGGASWHRLMITSPALHIRTSGTTQAMQYADATHLMTAGTSMHIMRWDGDTLAIVTNVPESYPTAQTDVLPCIVFPNPANNNINIKYTVQQTAKVSLRIYSTLGEPLRSMMQEEEYTPGVYHVQMNTASLSSGMYFVSLGVGSSTKIIPLVIER